MTPENQQTTRLDIHGWPVIVQSYRLAGRYYVNVSEGEAGARIARGDALTYDEAYRVAIDKATARLARTQRRT